MKSLSLLSVELLALLLSLGVVSASPAAASDFIYNVQQADGPTLQKRAPLDASLGLSAQHLLKNTVSIGFLPAWGEQQAPNNCSSINAALPEPMAVVGVYVQVNPEDADMSQLDYFLHDIMAQPAPLPVLNLALMPTVGFAAITQQVADNIGKKMREVNDKGLTVWLRYAHEMNGDWYPYAADPAGFQASWKMVADAVHAQTNTTYMTWAPNSFFAGDYNNMNHVGGYGAYWPNDTTTVDIVGLSFYTYGTHDRLNIMPPANMALDTLKFFDGLYGSAQNKPLILAETGASYTYSLDGEVGPGNATESAIKFDWLWQLLGPDTIAQVPSLKAITWFEVIKNENAGTGTEMKTEDFRLILGKPYIMQSAVNFFQQLSTVTNSTAGMNQAATNQSSVAAADTPQSSSADSSVFISHWTWLCAVLFSIALFASS